MHDSIFQIFIFMLLALWLQQGYVTSSFMSLFYPGRRKKGHMSFDCNHLTFLSTRKDIFSKWMLTIQMAKTILQATHSWKMARRKVFNFPPCVVQKSNIEDSLVSVINESNQSIFHNECTQSVLKRNFMGVIFSKSISKAFQYLI